MQIITRLLLRYHDTTALLRWLITGVMQFVSALSPSMDAKRKQMKTKRVREWSALLIGARRGNKSKRVFLRTNGHCLLWKRCWGEAWFLALHLENLFIGIKEDRSWMTFASYSYFHFSRSGHDACPCMLSVVSCSLLGPLTSRYNSGIVLWVTHTC